MEVIPGMVIILNKKHFGHDKLLIQVWLLQAGVLRPQKDLGRDKLLPIKI